MRLTVDSNLQAYSESVGDEVQVTTGPADGETYGDLLASPNPGGWTIRRRSLYAELSESGGVWTLTVTALSDDATAVVDIWWGDGESEPLDLGVSTSATHTYSDPGTYYVAVEMQVPEYAYVAGGVSGGPGLQAVVS